MVVPVFLALGALYPASDKLDSKTAFLETINKKRTKNRDHDVSADSLLCH